MWAFLIGQHFASYDNEQHILLEKYPRCKLPFHLPRSNTMCNIIINLPLSFNYGPKILEASPLVYVLCRLRMICFSPSIILPLYPYLFSSFFFILETIWVLSLSFTIYLLIFYMIVVCELDFFSFLKKLAINKLCLSVKSPCLSQNTFKDPLHVHRPLFPKYFKIF